MTATFGQGPIMPSVATLPAASSNTNRMLVQGGKLWFSDGTVWVNVGASAVPTFTTAYSLRPKATLIEACDTAWDDYYIGGEGSIDTAIKVNGTGSLKITAVGASTAGTSRLLAPAVSLATRDLRFYVRSNDWSLVTAFTLIFGSNSWALTNTLTIDIGTRLVNQPNNEWVEVAVPRSALLASGSPDIASIDIILAKVIASGAVSVWLDDITALERGNRPIVSVTLDDGYDDVFTTAKPIMDARGLVGTAYIAPTHIGLTNFMTEDQVKALEFSGWEIGGHAMVNLTTLTQEELEANLSATHEWLAARGLEGREHFSLPNGAYSAMVMGAVRRYFCTACNIDGWNNPTGYLSPRRINRQSIDKWTTPAMIADWVQAAVDNNEWCILNFHTLVSTLVDDQDFLTTDFTTVMDNLVSAGVEVLPVGRAIQALRAGDWAHVGTSQPTSPHVGQLWLDTN